MEEIKKALRLNKTSYYETHLNLLNCLLPKTMTPMEVKVLASFMSLEGPVAQYRFGPAAKKIVRQQLDISPAGLSNYIGSLTAKGFLINQSGVITILPILIPKSDEQVYMFKLINNAE